MSIQRDLKVQKKSVLSVGLISWLLSAAAFLPSAASAACTGFDEESGQHCTAFRPTPWYFWADLGYGLTLNPTYYASFAEITAAIHAKWMNEVSPPPCSLTLESVDYDTGTIPLAYQGANDTDLQHQHTLNYSRVWGWQGFECQIDEDYTPEVYQGRTFFCPVGSGAVFQSGPPQVGPYCARDYWRKDEEKSAGGCEEGQQKGQNWKGNPCEIASGNKYQRELDYAGSGTRPLKFERHYNSVLVKGYSSTQPKWEPFGVGWTASYFQRIDYFSIGTQATAFARRPDGQTLAFNPSGTAFVAAPDVDERLTALRDTSGNITGWTLRTEGDDVETYDAVGSLVSIAYRGGTTHTLQYTAADLLSSVRDGFGHELQFVLDNRHRVVEIVNPASGSFQYAYSSNNKLLSVTYPNQTARQYHYEDGSNTFYLTGITDETTNRYSTYSYSYHYYNDYLGDAASTELAGGVNKYQFSNIANDRIVTDPLGKVRTYVVSTKLHVNRITSSTAVCQGCGEAKTLAYDDNANINVRTDFNNVETRFAHDLTRNLETSRTEAYGTPKARTITTAWHATFRLPTQIDEPNRRTTFTHDTNGNVLTRTMTDLTVTPNVSRTWTYTYNSFGRVLTEDGPRTDVSDVTTYTYYSCTTGFQCGQVQTITNALGHVTSYNTYNAHGQPLTITDPNGLVTTLTYDARQRLTSRSAGGETTTLEYWPTGLLKKVTLPDTSFLLYTYDNAHRLTRIDDSEGSHIVYTLDAMGNRTKEETFDPSNYLTRLHHRAFTSLNQLWKEIGAANTAAVTTIFGYDDNGNQTSVSAPLGRNTANLYDELNRLKQITDPGSGVTLFGYDANDNLTSVTDSRTLVTSYLYNGFGDLKQQTSPDTGVSSSTYDSGGNLQTATDARNAITTYTYDGLNRVLTAAFKIGSTTDQTITHTYDGGVNGIGRLTGASDSSHSMSWTYDAQGRTTNKSQTVGTVTRSVAYSYTNENLTSMTTPSGQSVVYGYNSNHQVTSVTVNGTPVLSGVLYDPFGPVRGWTWGNGTLTVRTFDTDGKVTQVDSAGLKTYAYDDAFRITGITDTVTPANSWTYGYDALDRITSGVKTGTTRGWTYDANGNRLTETGSAASTYTVSTSSNRINSTAGTLARTFGYDPAGNTTTYVDVILSYNNRGRLKSTKKGTATRSYVYNALGQRVKASGGTGGTVLYWYDEAGHLLGEYKEVAPVFWTRV